MPRKLRSNTLIRISPQRHFHSYAFSKTTRRSTGLRRNPGKYATGDNKIPYGQLSTISSKTRRAVQHSPHDNHNCRNQEKSFHSPENPDAGPSSIILRLLPRRRTTRGAYPPITPRGWQAPPKHPPKSLCAATRVQRAYNEGITPERTAAGRGFRKR